MKLNTTAKRALVALAVTLTGMRGVARASQLSLGAAAGYNVFVFGDFTESGTDSEGKMAVAGNFAPAGNGSFTVASKHGSDTAGTYDLVVGGNFSNQYATLGGGDAFVGGNMNWFDPTLPNNAYVNGNFTNGGYGSVGGSIYHLGSYSSVGSLSNVPLAKPTSSPIDFLSAQTYLQSVSTTLSAQAANGMVSDNGYGTYTLTGANTGLNIFDLTTGNYSGFSINVNVPSNSTVVINVPGSADSFSGGSINITGVPANNVIFNFASASSISLNAIGFNGSILAPFASFNGNYGQINGQLIAQSASGTTEFHDVLFSGTLPNTPAGSTVTPEPATYASLLIGIGLIAIARRKVTSRD